MIPKEKYDKAREDLFNRYTQGYSQSDDKVNFISNLSNIRKDLATKVSDSRERLQERVYRLD